MLRLVQESRKEGTKAQPGVVIRSYQPQSSAMDDLVELLHQLLVQDADPRSPDSTPAEQQTTCFPGSAERGMSKWRSGSTYESAPRSNASVSPSPLSVSSPSVTASFTP